MRDYRHIGEIGTMLCKHHYEEWVEKERRRLRRRAALMYFGSVAVMLALLGLAVWNVVSI